MSANQVLQERLKPSDRPLAGLRIVLVDDNEDARQFAAHLLRCSGAEVMEVATAEEAHALVVSTAPDVLVSDIAMPTEDGHTLIRRVRSLPPPLGRTPAVALTAFASMEDKQRALAAGFDAYLSKAGSTMHAVIGTVAEVAQHRSGVHRRLAPRPA